MAYMSAITYTVAKARIARALGGQGDAAMLGAAGECLSQAMSEWNMKRDWNWTLTTNADITTVAGTSEYVLATNVKKMYDARLSGNKRELSYIDEREWRNARWDQTTTGTPMFYTEVFMGTPLTTYIKLGPIPNSSGETVIVRYFRKIAAPTADVDTLDIPAVYENGLIFLAKALILADRDAENARTSFFHTKAMEVLTHAIAEDDRQPDRGDRFIASAEHMKSAYDPTHPYFYLQLSD